MIDLPFNTVEFAEEIWKDIPDYEGIYKISSFGRVKSLSRKIPISNGGYRVTKEKLLKAGLSSGYESLTLYKNYKTRTFKIHKLMAIVFLKHIPSGYYLVVDHINDNPRDNKLLNLQIITQRENSSKKIRNRNGKYLGVRKNPKSYGWRADAYINGKNKYLGTYNSDYEAHLAYQSAIKKIKK